MAGSPTSTKPPSALLSPASSVYDAFVSLKSRVFSFRPCSSGPPTLPVELIYTILDLLPPPTAWHCRPVCHLWCAYIEHHLSPHWLEGTSMDMITQSNQPVFRIHSASPSPGDGRRGAYSFPYLRREGKWLVYGLQAFQRLMPDSIQRPLIPYLHPLAYIEYAKSREALTPRYTYELRRLQIHIIVTHLASGFHTGPTIALRSRWHPRVLQGARQEGFRLVPERGEGGEVWLDWRVVFSSMFEGGTQQWGAVPGGAVEQAKKRRQSAPTGPEGKVWRTRRTVYVVR